MYIREKRENVLRIVEEDIPAANLKRTENERLLWKATEQMGEYHARMRVSFREPDNMGDTISTENVSVKKTEKDCFSIFVNVDTRNFVISPYGQRCKIEEKEKGINSRCIIDKMSDK